MTSGSSYISLQSNHKQNAQQSQTGVEWSSRLRGGGGIQIHQWRYKTRPIVVRPLKSPIWLKLGKKISLLVQNTTPYMKKSNKLVSICIILAHKVIFLCN